MRSSLETLKAIKGWYPAGVLARSLACILRVPEAWFELSKPELRGRLRSLNGEAALTPAALGWASLDVPLNEPPDIGSLPPDLERRVDGAWAQLRSARRGPRRLADLQLVAVGLARELAERKEIAWFLAQFRADPGAWRSPLALAWPLLESPGDLVSELVGWQDPAGVMLAANSLLANHQAQEAVRHWPMLPPEQEARAVQSMHGHGEREFARALSTRDPGDPSAETNRSLLDDPELMLLISAKQIALGDLEAAQFSLDRAVQRTGVLRHSIAELAAALAQARGDSDLIQSIMGSLPDSPASPWMRAKMALAVVESGDLSRAQTLLSQANTNPAEALALASLLVAQGKLERGRGRLTRAVLEQYGLALRGPIWIDTLINLLHRLGDISRCLQVMETKAAVFGHSVQVQLELAEQFLAWGDPTSAETHAEMACALSPESQAPLRMLAEVLTAKGDYARASALWRDAAEDDPPALTKTAWCALQAGDLELAGDILARLENNAPDEKREAVLLGQIRSAEKDPGAEELLRLATDASPANPDGWLALANHLRSMEDFEGELETLAAGAQAAPAEAAVKVAYASALERAGRLSEALSAIQQACEIEPDRVDWMIDRGRLLLDLGHPHRAIATLEDAIRIRPLSLELRRVLARAYEQVGEAARAWGLLTPLLDRLPAGDILLAGRLSAKTGLEGDEQALELARRLFERASEISPAAEEIQYWLGELFLASGDPSRAKSEFKRCLGRQGEAPGPLDRDARIGFSEAALQAGDLDDALGILERVFDRYAHDSAFLVQLARVQLATGALTNALASAELAVERNPGNEAAYEALRQAAGATGNWSRAIKLHRDLISRNPDDSSLWLMLAILGVDSNQCELTREALAGALFANRRDPAVLARAAEILGTLGNGRFAFRLLSRAARLAPENPDYLLKYALKGEEIGDWAASLKAWNDLEGLLARDPRAILGVARCLGALGRTDEAILKLQAGLEADPQASELFLALAEALLGDNRTLAAIDLLSRVHNRFPSDAKLTKTAGLLMLDNGPAETALEVLKAAIRLQPHDLDLIIATADCSSRLGMFEESVRIMRGVRSREDSPALAAAIFASAALQSGDAQAVSEALDDCIQAEPSTDCEFELLTDALLRLGEWELAAKHARTWRQRARSKKSVLALIRLRLRLADAHWLFTRLSMATHHGPSEGWIGEESQRKLDGLLIEARELGLLEDQVQALDAHISLALGAQEDDLLIRSEERLLSRADPDLIEGLALAHLRSGDTLHCIRILSSEAAAPLSLEWAPLLLGIAHRRQGDYELAELEFEEAREAFLLRPYANYQLALSCIERGEIPAAISILNDALSSCPQEPAWQHLLARLYRGQDQLDAALPHFQLACELAPGEAEYALSLARAYREIGQPAAALRIFRKMLADSSGESDLWRQAGEVSLETGDYHQAGEYFQRATEISPADPSALIGYAQAAAATGQTRFARDLAQQALRTSPRDPQVLVGLARLLRMEGKLSAALDVYAKAIELSEDPLAVKIDRADLLVAAGEADQAITELQGLTDDPHEDDRIWGALARALETAGRIEPALEAITRATRIAPRSMTHRLQLARLCRKSGQLDRALHELAEMQSSAGVDSRLPVEMGRVYEARRDHSSALRCYQEAISQNPHNAEAFYRAGYVLKQLKAYPQAGKMLKRAVDLDPKNTEAHHQLAAVRALELVHYTINSPVGSKR